MLDSIRNFFTSAPKPRRSGLGAGHSDDDPAIPAFQQAWKDGATFQDMFGDKPFELQGSVGRTGADNNRADVAKVETFLGDAGFYKPMTNDGPNGWHNPNLDQGIRDFQKANGLKVDGILNPNGPTITKIGGVLGGGQGSVSEPNSKRISEEDAKRLLDRLQGGDHPQPQRPSPEAPSTPPRPPVHWPTGESEFDPPTTFPVPGHQISTDGAAEHDRYAQALTRDSDPAKSAAFLKNVIGWEGDKGRGDVADLLGRFHKIDPEKAQTLQSELHKLSGERIPFRVASMKANAGGPMADLAEGDTTPKANPWGSAESADQWEAGNMAKVLLGKSDYKDAVKHFAGEFERDPQTAKAQSAAIYDEMAKSSPKQAAQFANQMSAAGLAQTKKAEPVPEAPPPAPSAPAEQKQPADTNLPTPANQSVKGNGQSEAGSNQDRAEPDPMDGYDAWPKAEEEQQRKQEQQARKRLDDLGFEVVSDDHAAPLKGNQVTKSEYEQMVKEARNPGEWGVGDAARYWAEKNTGVAPKDRALAAHKDRQVRDQSALIKATARKHGLPPEVLAGILHTEVGGDPDIQDNIANVVRSGGTWANKDTGVEWIDKIKPTFPVNPPMTTSAGDVSIQLRNVAKFEGVDPDSLSMKERAALIDKLQEDKAYALEMAARHVKDTLTRAYPGYTGGPLTDDQIMTAGYGYNMGYPHKDLDPAQPARDRIGKSSYGPDLRKKLQRMRELLR